MPKCQNAKMPKCQNVAMDDPNIEIRGLAAAHFLVTYRLAAPQVIQLRRASAPQYVYSRTRAVPSCPMTSASPHDCPVSCIPQRREDKVGEIRSESPLRGGKSNFLIVIFIRCLIDRLLNIVENKVGRVPLPKLGTTLIRDSTVHT